MKSASNRIKYYLGLILTPLELSFIAPAIVSLLYLEVEDYTIVYLIASVIIILLGLLFWKDSVREEITYIDSLYIAIFSFLYPALINTAITALNGFDPWDPLFENISSKATTELSIFNINDLLRTIIL